ATADVNRGALQNWRRAGLIRRERRPDSACHERWRREQGRHKWRPGADIDERLHSADRRLHRKNRVVIVGGVPQTTQPGLIGIAFLADLFEVALQADTYADHLKERPFIAQLAPASSVACVVPHAVREARTQPGAPARWALGRTRPRRQRPGPPGAGSRRRCRAITPPVGSR